MPVRARKSRRRDQRSELDAWSMYFQSGYDFFDDLAAIGVVTNHHDVPDTEVAREAWQRLGQEYMTDRPSQNTEADREPHALRVFGQPAKGNIHAGA